MLLSNKATLASARTLSRLTTGLVHARALSSTASLRSAHDEKSSASESAFVRPTTSASGTQLNKPVQISYNPPNKGASGGGSITLKLPPNLVEAMSRKKNNAPTSKASSARAKAQASKALRETLTQPTTGDVYAWATSYSYDFSELVRSGRLPPTYRIFEDNEVIHIPQWPIPSAASTSSASSSELSASMGQGEVFIFRSGSYVTWGLDEGQSARFLRSVIQGRDPKYNVEVGRYAQIGDEAMEYLYADSQPTRVQGDILVIGQAPRSFDTEDDVASTASLEDSTALDSSVEQADLAASSSSSKDSSNSAYVSFGSEWTPTLARLAYSQGLARSARLSVQESSLSRFLSTVSSIPSQLETVGKVPLSRTSVIKNMGTLLRLRQTANLDRDNFYDEPEVYWENSKLEDHYRSICHELDISQRFETLNEKLDHCENLLAVVRALLTEASTHRMELIIIALIAFEATIAVISHDWLPTPSNLSEWWSSMSTYFSGSSPTAPPPEPLPVTQHHHTV